MAQTWERFFVLRLTGHLALALFLLALAGCASKTVQYKTDSVAKSSHPPLKVRLLVGPLQDARSGHPPSQILMDGKQMVKMGGSSTCVNAERYYRKNGPVADQVGEAMRSHFQARGSYLDVTTDQSLKAHYTLVGSVSALYGHQRVSSAAQAGAMFGVAGALASSGAQSDTRVEIAITNLRIFDANKKPVAKLNDVKVEFESPMPADAHCWKIYDNVHAKLREAVEQLAKELEAEIRRVHSAKT